MQLFSSNKRFFSFHTYAVYLLLYSHVRISRIIINILYLFFLFSDLKPLLDNLGLFFQIRDDYANLCVNEVSMFYESIFFENFTFLSLFLKYSKNKGFAEDLTEGKFSFPIIHSLNVEKNKSKIMSILRQRTEDIDVKKYCVQLIQESGSFDYTVQVLKKLESE